MRKSQLLLLVLMIIPILAGLALTVLYRKSLTMRNQLPYNETYEFASKKMSYKVLGTGDPVILVHGSMYSRPWDGFDQQLAKTNTVYLPELPGFGASDTIPGRLHNTDLFAEALCEFIKQEKLEKAPVIGFSLGTIVVTKAAATDCTQGKLILVGMPGKVEGFMPRLSQVTPVFLKRMIIATDVGKTKMLIPALRQNIGSSEKGVSDTFLNNLRTTSPQSLVDTDYKKESEVDLPAALAKAKNEKVYIYGENDALKNTTTSWISEYITIPNAPHNVFSAQPQKTMEVLKKIIMN